MAKVTSKDVGRLAGVHPSTVSRVMNRAFDKYTYDPETIARVEKSARQLGYRPSNAARALRMGKTMLLGVVVSDIANSFFGELASLIERYARAKGYRALICNTHDDPEQQAEHLQDLSARHVDGIILCPSGLSGCERLITGGHPLVMVNRPALLGQAPYVGLNNQLAGRMLGEHLRNLGKTSIGVVMPEIPHHPTLIERFNGLLEGMDNQVSVQWTVSGPIEWLPVQGRKLIAQRVASNTPPVEAVIGLTSQSTLAIIHALGDLDLRIGSQMGVAGIDDFTAATVVRPGITIIAQPVDQIARHATDLLIQRIADSEQPVQTLRMTPTLQVRGSLGETTQSPQILTAHS